MVMVEIIPGILEKEWTEIERKFGIIKPFTKSVHIDILDKKFTKNTAGTTFLDPTSFSKYSQDLFLEVHMMVEDPIQYLESFAQAGFKRFIGHIEKMPDQLEFVAKAKQFGEVGLAVDGQTPLEKIKVSLSDLDSITIMTIEAGKSGQVFNQKYLEKVRILRSPQYGVKIPIEIDGGVNDETIIFGKNAGADRFVANSAIFKYPDPSLRFKLLQTIAENKKNAKPN
jgi:ribulose-phosphate 3-epimerase